MLKHEEYIKVYFWWKKNSGLKESDFSLVAFHCIAQSSSAQGRQLGLYGRDWANIKNKQHPQIRRCTVWEHQSKPNPEISWGGGEGVRSLTKRRWTLKEKSTRSSISDGSAQSQTEMGANKFPRFLIICCHGTNSRDNTERLSLKSYKKIQD